MLVLFLRRILTLCASHKESHQKSQSLGTQNQLSAPEAKWASFYEKRNHIYNGFQDR